MVIGVDDVALGIEAASLVLKVVRKISKLIAAPEEVKGVLEELKTHEAFYNEARTLFPEDTSGALHGLLDSYRDKLRELDFLLEHEIIQPAGNGSGKFSVNRIKWSLKERNIRRLLLRCSQSRMDVGSLELTHMSQRLQNVATAQQTAANSSYSRYHSLVRESRRHFEAMRQELQHATHDMEDASYDLRGSNDVFEMHLQRQESKMQFMAETLAHLTDHLHLNDHTIAGASFDVAFGRMRPSAHSPAPLPLTEHNHHLSQPFVGPSLLRQARASTNTDRTTVISTEDRCCTGTCSCACHNHDEQLQRNINPSSASRMLQDCSTFDCRRRGYLAIKIWFNEIVVIDRPVLHLLEAWYSGKPILPPSLGQAMAESLYEEAICHLGVESVTDMNDHVQVVLRNLESGQELVGQDPATSFSRLRAVIQVLLDGNSATPGQTYGVKYSNDGRSTALVTTHMGTKVVVWEHHGTGAFRSQDLSSQGKIDDPEVTNEIPKPRRKQTYKPKPLLRARGIHSSSKSLTPKTTHKSRKSRPMCKGSLAQSFKAMVVGHRLIKGLRVAKSRPTEDNIGAKFDMATDLQDETSDNEIMTRSMTVSPSPRSESPFGGTHSDYWDPLDSEIEDDIVASWVRHPRVEDSATDFSSDMPSDVAHVAVLHRPVPPASSASLDVSDERTVGSRRLKDDETSNMSRSTTTLSADELSSTNSSFNRPHTPQAHDLQATAYVAGSPRLFQELEGIGASFDNPDDTLVFDDGETEAMQTSMSIRDIQGAVRTYHTDRKHSGEKDGLLTFFPTTMIDEA